MIADVYGEDGCEQFGDQAEDLEVEQQDGIVDESSELEESDNELLGDKLASNTKSRTRSKQRFQEPGLCISRIEKVLAKRKDLTK